MRILPLLLAAALAPWIALAQDDTNSNDGLAMRATTMFNHDGTKTVTVIDSGKHTSEASTYDAADKLLRKVVYALDDQNQFVSGVVYNAANVPMYKATYKRDDSNRVTEEDDYTMDDQLLRRFVYDFDSQGDILRIHTFDGQGNEMLPDDARKDPKQVPPRRH
jgi:hypothetical protein